MADEVVRKNDVGVALQAAVKKRDGSALDVSAATSLTMVFTKPDGETISRPANAANGGADGVVQYVTAEGDLDQTGTWKVDVVVEAPGLHITSTTYKFKVGAVLDDAA